MLYVALFALFLFVAGPVIYLFPNITLFLPAYMLYVSQRAGYPAGTICVAMLLSYALFFGNLAMLGIIMLAVLPGLVYMFYAFSSDMPFLKSVLYSVLALFLGACAASTLAMALTGGNLVGTITAYYEAILEASPYTDTMLYVAHTRGLIKLTSAIKIPYIPSLFDSGVVITPAARSELMRSLLLQFEQSLTLLLPSQIVTGAIFGGLMGQYLPRHAMRKQGTPCDLPPLRIWHIPAGKGRYIIAPAIIAIFYAMMSGSSGALSAYYVLYGGASLIFKIQGLAILAYLCNKNGQSRLLRNVLVALGFMMPDYSLLGFLVVMVGMIDQKFDIRHLRKPPEEHDKDKEDFYS